MNKVWKGGWGGGGGGVGGGGGGEIDPNLHLPLLFNENPASRTSFIAIPNIVFFPNPTKNRDNVWKFKRN